MIRILEIYYLIGWLLGLSVFLIGILQNKYRIFLILFSITLTMGSFFDACVLKKRSQVIRNQFFSNASDLDKILGSPEAIFNYTEGDCEWVYSVRVWPWNVSGTYSIYKNHVISVSIDRNIGLFYRPKRIFRTPAGSRTVKKFLEDYDNGKVNLRPVRGIINEQK